MTVTQGVQTFAVGDLVTGDPVSFPGLASKVMRIEKVPTGPRGVNYVAKPLDGSRGARGPAYCFRPHQPDGTPGVGMLGVPYEEIPLPPMNGSVVKIAGRGWKGDPATLYVVVAESRKGGGVKVYPLGGSDRYYPHVPLSMVTVVPLDVLAEALVDAL